jgi:two-component system nitrogen regulation sensor histidine kinase GlnL
MGVMREQMRADDIRQYTFSADRGLRINSWGEEMAEFTGKSSSEVLGRKYYEVFPRILSGDKDALLLAMKKEEMFLKDYRFNCFYGYNVADIGIKSVKAKGGVEGVMVAISVTKVCSAVRKLQEFQRLIDIGKIGSTLAHGIRNPLNAMKGAIVFLRGKYADEPTLGEFAKLMEFETSRLDNFISRFLSTSILDAGAETDINSLLREIELYTSLHLQASDIRTVFEYGHTPPVVIDAFYLEQAVLNIISNSIEAMNSGGKLTVRTRAEKQSGVDYAVIDISDTGPGMDVNKADSIPFPSEDKRKGYGLFITREILKYYGGYLKIESEKDVGTTVRLCVPYRAG